MSSYFVFLIIYALVPRVPALNPISPLGLKALWKKNALSDAAPKRTPPPARVLAMSNDVRCPTPPRARSDLAAFPSPSISRPNSPERFAHVASSDTSACDKIKLEEDQEPSAPVLTLEECLEEKVKIDRVLAERSKLGPFLLESTDRPAITDMRVFEDSAEAIRATILNAKSHLHDNVTALEREYRCYGLTLIGVKAIHLYTTSIAYVVNKALRNYSFYQTPIRPDFLPYIYALLNALAIFDRRREMNEATDFDEPVSSPVARYVEVLTPKERAAFEPVLNAHQPGAYVMYPAFTSSSVADRCKALWSDGIECKFEIMARTAIPIDNFSIHPYEHEAVFLPGTMFHILGREGICYVMEEVLPQKLKARRDALPC